MPSSLKSGGNLMFLLTELPLILRAQAAPCHPYPHPGRLQGAPHAAASPAAAPGSPVPGWQDLPSDARRARWASCSSFVPSPFGFMF